MWCADPRCEPYCTNCQIPQSRDATVNLLFLILVIAFAILIVVIWAFGGPRVINNHPTPVPY